MSFYLYQTENTPAFNNIDICMRWKNCLIITQSMSFISINQEMKGNHCANALLRHGHTINDFYQWLHLPIVVVG